MLILDKPKPLKDQILRIPLYHRGHLSLLAGTEVWLCLLPGTKSPSHLPEIIVSPINFESWSDLWRIEATLYEGVGVVYQLLKVLREHNVNVLAEESSSIERQRYHTVELVADARQHKGPSDGDYSKRSSGIIEALPDLRRALLAEVIQQITFWPTGEPRLKISRMKGLHEAAEAFDIAHRNYLNGQGFRPTVEHTEASVDQSRGWISLPSELMRTLNETLSVPGEAARGRFHRDMTPSYLLVSDTKERYLRAYFMKPTDAILSVTIEHEEKIGALARITDTLQHNGFNILTSLSRLYAHGRRAQYELVLQPPMDLGDDQTKLRKEFEKTLGTRELIGDYKLAVSYKTNYTSPLQFSFVPESKAARRVVAQPESATTVEDLLNKQYSALAVRKRSPGASDEDILRFSLAGRLLDEERRVQLTYVPRKILFLSFSFEHSSSHTEKVIEEARKLGFEVLVGKKLKEHVHREGIIRLISESTDFLGIWAEEGALRVGRHYWPSPWLHWEMGVAAAKGLKPRLLISEKIHRESWKVYPEVPHTIFETSMFLEALMETLEIMAAERVYE